MSSSDDIETFLYSFSLPITSFNALYYLVCEFSRKNTLCNICSPEKESGIPELKNRVTDYDVIKPS